jgi:hypothetical protein
VENAANMLHYNAQDVHRSMLKVKSQSNGQPIQQNKAKTHDLKSFELFREI